MKVRNRQKVLFALKMLLAVGLDAKWTPGLMLRSCCYCKKSLQLCSVVPLKWCLKITELPNGCNVSQWMTKENLRCWSFILNWVALCVKSMASPHCRHTAERSAHGTLCMASLLWNPLCFSVHSNPDLLILQATRNFLFFPKHWVYHDFMPMHVCWN